MRRYLFKYKWRLIHAIFWAIINSAVTVSLAIILQIIIDAGTQNDYTKLKTGLVLALVYTIVMLCVNYLRRSSQAIYIKKTMLDFKNDMFSQIIDKNIDTFNSENSGKYLSMMTNDIKIIEVDCFEKIIDLFRAIALLLFALICIFYMNPIISIIAIVLSILPMIIPQLFDKRLKTVKSHYSTNQERYTSDLKDVFMGIEVIKGFGIESKVKEKIQTKTQNSEESNCRYKKLEGLVLSLSSSMGDLTMYAIMIVSILLVIKGNMTLGMMIAIVQLMNYVLGPAFEIVESVVKLKSIKNITSKFKDLEEVERIQERSSNDIIAFNNNISLDKIKFQYNEQHTILNGISTTFTYGKKYAIVGASGSGKSTLVKLLLRYYDNYEGDIYIDGVELRSIHKQSLYKLVSIINQNPIMFEDTIRNNITLFADYPESEIMNAIEKAKLKEFIEKQPHGLDTVIQENGNNISGGEKQRFAIARALIRKTPIIILDEATSNLDPETTYSIESSILELENLTALVITHHLKDEMLRKYDEIVVLKDGMVSEKGDFDSLIDEKQLFYSMYFIGETVDR